MAQVARADFAFPATSAPRGPAAASAAPSATPWQPTSRNTASDGWRSRGASASRTSAPKKRAGTPSDPASACTAGSSALRSIENTPPTAPGASPAASRQARASASTSSGAAPRSQPMPSAIRRGVVDQRGRRALDAGVVRQDRQRSRAAGRQVARGKPFDAGWQADPRALQQGGDEGFAMLRVRERPALGRVVEGDAEAAVAGGGGRGGRADGGGDALGEGDAPAVRAEDGHRERAVLGDGDHGGLRALVAERRRDRPHQDPRRADPDDRAPGLEQRPDVAGRVVEAHVCTGGAMPVERRGPILLLVEAHAGARAGAPAGFRDPGVVLRDPGTGRRNPGSEPVDLGIAERGGDPARERRAAGGERHDRGARAYSHANPRRCTSTIEK